MQELKGYKKAVYYISFPLSFIGFMLPIYALELGASAIEVGILYTVFSLSALILKPFVGRFIDRKGRKTGFIFGCIGYLTMLLLLFASNGYNYILAARIVQSIASSFAWISINAMITDVSEEDEISKNFGILDKLCNKGAIIGAVIGFALFFNQIIQLNRIFMIYIICVFIGMYFAIKDGRETFKFVKNEAGDEKKPIKDILSKEFIKYLIIMFIICFASTMIAPIFFVYLRDQITESIVKMSYLFVPGAVLSILLPVKAGKLCDKYGKKNILALAIIGDAVFTLIIPFAKSYVSFLMVYTAITAASIIEEPTISGITSEYCSVNTRALTFSIKSFVVGIAASIGPIVGTVIYETIGMTIVFYIQGVMLLISALMIKKFIQSKKYVKCS